MMYLYDTVYIYVPKIMHTLCLKDNKIRTAIVVPVHGYMTCFFLVLSISLLCVTYMYFRAGCCILMIIDLIMYNI